MPSTHSKRDVLRLCGVTFGLGTAGCLGDTADRDGSPETDGRDSTTRADSTSNSTTRPDSTSTTSDSTGTHTQSTTSERTTIASSVLSDEEAKERALTAEEEFLTDRLQNASCLENWGTYGATMNEQATVTERTADGVRVEVKHPFSYSTDSVEADLASNAVYVVTPEETRRVSGDRVSLC